MKTGKNIAVLGAGKSSNVLIKYLLNECIANDWSLFLSDQNKNAAESKLNNHPKGSFLEMNIPNNLDALKDMQIVISLLPPDLHFSVANFCVDYKIHFISASYITKEIQALHQKAIENNVTLLMECGLDPGIDHMSAMKEINQIHSEGGKIVSFESYCGGLVSPESDDNPWHYKISWNPRNVVLAGQGGATKYLQNNQLIEVSYSNLFLNPQEIEIAGYGTFEGYPNRDSLSYISLYGLSDISSIVRGTLRKKGFCKSWHMLIELGYTDNQTIIPKNIKTLQQLTNYLEDKNLKSSSLKGKMLELFPSEKERIEIYLKLEFLGIFSNEPIQSQLQTPASILQKIIENKWKLKPQDNDMVVMKHRIKYQKSNLFFQKNCELVLKGSSDETAMAKTVGLPLGIITKLILNNNINLKGVFIPLAKEIIEPVLFELKNFGITFKKSEIKMD
ncbi:MAG: saccharopine dehydrogenase C-terminal domain-containing protein [Bacteroidota bacterium]|nr:saccharopine dehydrogenase C-terminal domain-containing protein [Bacteroidota bacterium]